MAEWSRATQRYLCRDGEIFETMVRGIEERTDALTEVLEKYMRKSEKPVSRVTAPGSYLSDTSVLQKALASKQSEKFKALWNVSSRTERATARRMRPCVRCWRSGAAAIQSRWTGCSGIRL